MCQGNNTVDRCIKANYPIQTMGQSAQKILDEIKRQPADQPVIVIGHNGPTGLGKRRRDPCGKDFRPSEGKLLQVVSRTWDSVRLSSTEASQASSRAESCGALRKHHLAGGDVGWRCAGDFGDQDLREALNAAAAQGRHVPLVAFGHMHQALHYRYGKGRRNMVQIDPATGNT